jgi:regulator of sigma E protease
LTVAIGLGLVIFFHELGHFAVAKWCGVLVERFSIGFGPIVWRKKWGETEYALSAIPFGGYVKMLGQDDIDPSQLTSEEIAENPRSFTAKSVPQRMAIISAGVIMNVITGLLFFIIAFRLGVETTPAVVGEIQAGMPAWNAGIESGDRIVRINGRDIQDFNDLMRATALSSGVLDIQAVRPDGEVYSVTLQPDMSGTRRRIGVAPAFGLSLFDRETAAELPTVVPGTAAAHANPPLQPDDVVTAVDGEPVEDFAELSQLLSDRRAEPVTLTVVRTEEEEGKASREQHLETVLPPAPFRTMGMRLDIGKIVAIQHDSPAARAGIVIGDRLASVDGRDIGKDIDPLRLPDYFAAQHGKQVTVGINREIPGGQSEVEELTIAPEDRGGWTVPPTFEQTPLAGPALGIAYHVQSKVLAVDEGSPAALAGIRPLDAITKLELIRPAAAPPDGLEGDILSIDIGETNLAFAFWQMQQFPARQVRMTVQSAGSNETRTVDVASTESEDWFLPTTRGIRFFPLAQPRQAESISEAFAMGWHHTRSSIVDIYLTLRNLVTRRLSVRELHGPLGIIQVASDVAEVGIAPFLVFLGFLSVNLAVLNFLPIPVLDGGHMVFLIWEGISRKRPSEQVVVAATLAGMVFVVALMALVLYLDISRWYGGAM